MALYLGSIYSTLELRMDKLESDVARAKSTLGGLDKQMDSSSGLASKLGSAAGKVMKAGLVAGAAGAATLTAGLTKASKASWDQVDAVEQATVGLRAYERDGAKVEKVLGSLVSYARSDMGVLFNRRDLFQSAQMMKLNGMETEDLSKNVQILSRSVGIGLGNWDLLNRSVGRVLSTGRLTGIEFDILTQSGFALDKSLRNTNMSADELFAALDKGIPTDALAGQANTIRGLGIRMESAFRGIGDAVLQVDADTSQFVEGGLGNRLVKGMGAFTDVLKNAQPIIRDVGGRLLAMGDVIVADFLPTIEMGVEGIMGFAREFANEAAPAVMKVYNAIVNSLLPGIREFMASPFVSFVGQVLTFAFITAANAAALLIQGLGWLLTNFQSLVPILTMVIASIGLYRGAVIATNAVHTIQSALLMLQGTRYMMVNGALIAVRTSTIAQTVAQKALNLVMSMNPIGLVIGALGALVTAFGFATAATNKKKDAAAEADRVSALYKNQLLATADAADRLTMSQDILAGAKLTVREADLELSRAEKALEELKKSGKASSDDLEAAEIRVERAKLRVKDANAEATQAEKDHKTAVNEGRKESQKAEIDDANRKVGLMNVRGEINNNRTSLGFLRDDLNLLNGKTFTYTVEQRMKDVRVVNDGVSSPQAKREAGQRIYDANNRFMGGPVRRGQPYFVGENRDGSLNRTSELFVPGQSGRIVSSGDLQQMLRGASQAPKGMPTARTLSDSLFAARDASSGDFDGATFNITMNGVQDPDGFTRELKLAFAGRGK